MNDDREIKLAKARESLRIKKQIAIRGVPIEQKKDRRSVSWRSKGHPTHDTYLETAEFTYGSDKADIDLHMNGEASIKRYRVIGNHEVEIPNMVIYRHKRYKVTAIGEEAFADLKDMTQVRFPKYLRSVGYRAFADCKNLETVEMNECLQYIGAEAFSDCPSLRSVVVPNDVKDIGDRAFENSGLLAIALPLKARLTGMEILYRTKIIELWVPDEVADLNQLMPDSDCLKYLHIPGHLDSEDFLSRFPNLRSVSVSCDDKE